MHQCFSAALSSLPFFKIYSQMHSIKTEKKSIVTTAGSPLEKKAQEALYLPLVQNRYHQDPYQCLHRQLPPQYHSFSLVVIYFHLLKQPTAITENTHSLQAYYLYLWQYKQMKSTPFEVIYGQNVLFIKLWRSLFLFVGFHNSWDNPILYYKLKASDFVLLH